MRLGIMQPYFFPYLGYYSLAKKTDLFILFDTVQFIRHGWIERNRILKPVEGWQYIAVPLEKNTITISINEAKIRKTEDWKNKIYRQIEHYKKRAPYYSQTIEVIKDALNIETDSIVKLNENVLKVTCDYFGISLNIEIFSEMNLQIEKVNHPGEWALNIAKAMSASEYLNPTGGVEIFQPEQFKKAGIGLSFIGNNLAPYRQGRSTFEPGLSIIDVMMFNDTRQINDLIDDIQLMNV